MLSFPRRRESWLDLNNGLFLHSFLNIKQDSRLRGNDGNLTVSGFILGFAKVSECGINFEKRKWMNNKK